MVIRKLRKSDEQKGEKKDRKERSNIGGKNEKEIEIKRIFI